VPIVDLFADAPLGNPKASAYLLPAYVGWFPPATIFLCVVDPGVGGTRPAIILAADGRWYVGSGNGLFELVQRRADGKTRSWDIECKPDRLSASFHGRDLFAPVAAMLARGEPPPGRLREDDADRRSISSIPPIPTVQKFPSSSSAKFSILMTACSSPRRAD
jgi:S-adenosyl-L-methionine hydrolase (adenosine-forming)